MLGAMSEGTNSGPAEGSSADAQRVPEARLRRLEIRKFRNVRPTTLTFDDEWNVLLGKNGTGKTTLLELIAATLRGDLEALIKLDPDVELRAELSFGPANLTWVVEPREPSPAPPVLVAPEGLRLQATEGPDRAFAVRVSGDGLLSYEKKGTKEGFEGHSGATFVTKADSEAWFAFALVIGHRDASKEPIWENPPLQRAIAAASRAADVIRFDELLTVFHNIGPEGNLAIRRVFGSVRGPFCSEELSKAVDEVEPANKQTDGEQLSLGHEKLSFLGRFVALCGFEAGWLQLADLGRIYTAGKLVSEFGRPSFLFRRHNRQELRENRLSFGQKRLLSFLYYATVADPIVADELVDGLHYDWIKACVDEVRGRQKFFASQNPLLVDHMRGFKKRESVRSRFLRCTVEGDDLVWANFSEAEADDFFVAYRTGISAVSDVLRRKGLW